jgi:glycosyltransferase involved in cell wall biosynthesis
MHCPTLAELPPPPAGKTGWPWTIETPKLPPARPGGSPWPRISIVTPSYNQGQFIEETIRSILLQGYPDLEYVIIDGASTDHSVEIIKKYEPWLTYWVSEPDRGQSHAINKGFSRLSGDYVNWINSDDFLYRDALRVIAEAAALADDVDLISGVRILKDPATGYEFAHNAWRASWPSYLYGEPDFPQEATFFSKYLLINLKGVDERFQYAMDVAFFYRCLSLARKVILSDSIISKMYFYAEQKTHRPDKRKAVENRIVVEEYASKLVDRL